MSRALPNLTTARAAGWVHFPEVQPPCDRLQYFRERRAAFVARGLTTAGKPRRRVAVRADLAGLTGTARHTRYMQIWRAEIKRRDAL